MKFQIPKIMTLVALMGCSNTTNNGNTSQNDTANTYSPKPSNLRISLTDAPNDNLTNVFIDIEKVELWVSKGGIEKRLVLPNKHGIIDLLQLQNGLKMVFEDVNMPASVSVRQIRLILKPQGHYAIKNNGNTCQLHTPSAQQSGVKILLPNPITFDSGYSYSMLLDFDAKKSIVQQGNGGCLLKPVIRLQSATRLPDEEVDDDGSTNSPGDDLLGGETPENGDGGTDGWDPDDPSTWPDGVTEDNIGDYL